MTSSPEIIIPRHPEEVPFDALCAMLQAAFAFQDGIVDPPSSAKAVSVSELQWRFARDTLILARNNAGAPVGQVWLEDAGRELYLYKLGIDTAIQRSGIGSALIAAALGHARKMGKETIRLHVRIELAGNIAFFKRQGFAITGEGSHPGYTRPTFVKMTRDVGETARP